MSWRVALSCGPRSCSGVAWLELAQIFLGQMFHFVGCGPCASCLLNLDQYLLDPDFPRPFLICTTTIHRENIIFDFLCAVIKEQIFGFWFCCSRLWFAKPEPTRVLPEMFTFVILTMFQPPLIYQAIAKMCSIMVHIFEFWSCHNYIWSMKQWQKCVHDKINILWILILVCLFC